MDAARERRLARIADVAQDVEVRPGPAPDRKLSPRWSTAVGPPPPEPVAVPGRAGVYRRSISTSLMVEKRGRRSGERDAAPASVPSRQARSRSRQSYLARSVTVSTLANEWCAPAGRQMKHFVAVPGARTHVNFVPCDRYRGAIFARRTPGITSRTNDGKATVEWESGASNHRAGRRTRPSKPAEAVATPTKRGSPPIGNESSNRKAGPGPDLSHGSSSGGPILRIPGAGRRCFSGATPRGPGPPGSLAPW